MEYHTRGHAFTTGSSPDGYELTSVYLYLMQGSSTAPTVTLNEANFTGNPSLRPGKVIATLTGSTATTGSNTFTAPAGTNLEPDTTYFLVAGGGTGYLWGTSRVGIDPESEVLPRWTIADRNVSRYMPSDGTYRDWRPTGGMMVFALNGKVKNPDTTAPTLQSATVNGNTLVLTYDENLDDTLPSNRVSSSNGSVPERSLFGVKMDGGAAFAPDSVQTADNVTTLNLPKDVLHGQRARLRYINPGI